jgi:hypothetical protein
MKKLAAVLLALPRLAFADESVTLQASADETSPRLAANTEMGAGGDVAPASAAASASSVPEADAAEAAEGAGEGEPSALSYGAEVDVASRYVWRGLAFSEHPVVQPSARVSEYGATLGVSSSAYLGNEPGVRDTISELDLTGRYDFSVGAVSISPAIGAYLYPHGPSTAELSTAVSYDLGVVALQTHQALDVADNAGGYYADVAAARSQALGSRLRLEAAASLGWCSGRFGRYYIDETLEGMHWGAAQLDSSLTVSATEALYVRLHGTVSRMMEEHIRDMGPVENLVSGGLALGMAH